jgi:hypothetical protein
MTNKSAEPRRDTCQEGFRHVLMSNIEAADFIAIILIMVMLALWVG